MEDPNNIPADPQDQTLPPSEVDKRPRLTLVPDDPRTDEAKKLAEVPLVPITGRPEGMTYQAYKELQRQQGKKLKSHKRGHVLHISTQVMLVKDESGAVQMDKKTGKPTRLVRKKTYKRPPEK